MSDSRKTLNIEGGQVKEDDHIASYKPIPESDTGFRSSKPNLSKSKEKLSDGAEEKLLQREKDDEARIVTKVALDMPEAKYVVGDHRNGDAKIELDANKRQFTGLTKDELLKYAEDPFWVRLRWCMFVLFWALWLCMLAGAIAIIVRAPKCAPPPPKTWYQIGPLADRSAPLSADRSAAPSYENLLLELPLLSAAKVQGVFVHGCDYAYDVLDTPEPSCLEAFKKLAAEAKKLGVKLIVELTANFVSKTHAWFVKSENQTEGFSDYFIWGVGKDFDTLSGHKKRPNNWVSTLNEDAWTWSDKRQEYYLHQYDANTPDLNFTNPTVVAHFDTVLKTWMTAGAAGVRLHHARQLLVNFSSSAPNDETPILTVRDSKPDYTMYLSLTHKHTSDQFQLDSLLAHWSHIVAKSSTDTVFTLAEDGVLPVEWHRLDRNSSSLRPPSLAPIHVTADSNVTAVADRLSKSLKKWPAVQLISRESEVATLAMLLPAAPVLGDDVLEQQSNDTAPSESFAHLAALRLDASIQHGEYVLAAVPAVNSTNQLLACARWKSGHTGYLAVFNPRAEEARANLTARIPAMPESLTLHHVSLPARRRTDYKPNEAIQADDVLVPGKAALVLSYVPQAVAEQ